MTKKEAFIEIIQKEIFDNSSIYAENYPLETYEKAREYFEELKSSKGTSSPVTENGAKILSWMQENLENTSNLFTSKEIAEGLFVSGHSVSGSMRKLVKEEYVEKTGQNPIQYSLTEKGKSYNI